MITPPVTGNQFRAKNGTLYNIDVVFPPLKDEDGGVFRVISLDYNNLVLKTGNQIVTNIRQRTDLTWEEVLTALPTANYPNAEI